MVKNANLPTVWLNFAQWPDTLNTRQICVGPTTVWVFALMVPDATLFTIWRKPVNKKDDNNKLTKLLVVAVQRI